MRDCPDNSGAISLAFPVTHRPITSKGITYKLHHLQPFTITLVGHGKEGRNLTVRVSYHSHVYSKADTPEAVEHRFQDEGGKWREFCVKRYTWCLTLPAHCQTMVEENFPTWESKDRNRINNLVICTAQPVTGTHYAILYELLPSKATGIDIELVVKSAYERFFDMKKSGMRPKIRALIKKSHFENVRIPKQ